MAFFDELSKRMSGVAQTAQKTAEIARIQRQINLKQDEFDALFSNIGQLYYNCRKRDVEPDETMTVLCAKVDMLAAEIEGLKLKLDDLKQIRRCPGCGSIQNNVSRFCANCGEKLAEPEPEPEEEPAPAEPAQEAQENEEDEKSVYINWPETGSASDEDEKPAEASDSADEDK